MFIHQAFTDVYYIPGTVQRPWGTKTIQTQFCPLRAHSLVDLTETRIMFNLIYQPYWKTNEHLFNAHNVRHLGRQGD